MATNRRQERRSPTLRNGLPAMALLLAIPAAIRAEHLVEAGAGRVWAPPQYEIRERLVVTPPAYEWREVEVCDDRRRETRPVLQCVYPRGKIGLRVGLIEKSLRAATLPMNAGYGVGLHAAGHGECAFAQARHCETEWQRVLVRPETRRIVRERVLVRPGQWVGSRAGENPITLAQPDQSFLPGRQLQPPSQGVR